MTLVLLFKSGIMTILLNKEIKKGIHKSELKAVTLAGFLISKGFTSSKEINKTSLQDLKYKGQTIKTASLLNYELIIEFYKETRQTATKGGQINNN